MFSLCHYVIEGDYAHADRSDSVDQRLFQHTHIHTQTLSFILPSLFLPLISPFTPPTLSTGHWVLSNLFQMLNTSLPSLPFVFNSHRVDWNTESPTTNLTTLSILLSATKHEPLRSSRRDGSSPKTERNAKVNAFPSLHDVMLVLLPLATVHFSSASLWHAPWLMGLLLFSGRHDE